MGGIVVKVILSLFGALIACAGIISYEAFWVALVKYAGFERATIIRFIFTLVFSWCVIRLASGSRQSRRVREWLAGKEAGMSIRARRIAGGGKVLAVINTAIFLGPPIASILMMVLGIAVRRVYLYATLCSLFVAGLWCGLYSGMIWTAGKMFAAR